MLLSPRQASLHRELGLRQEDGVFIVLLFGHIARVLRGLRGKDKAKKHLSHGERNLPPQGRPDRVDILAPDIAVEARRNLAQLLWLGQSLV